MPGNQMTVAGHSDFLRHANEAMGETIFYFTHQLYLQHNKCVSRLPQNACLYVCANSCVSSVYS